MWPLGVVCRIFGYELNGTVDVLRFIPDRPAIWRTVVIHDHITASFKQARGLRATCRTGLNHQVSSAPKLRAVSGFAIGRKFRPGKCPCPLFDDILSGGNRNVKFLRQPFERFSRAVSVANLAGFLRIQFYLVMPWLVAGHV